MAVKQTAIDSLERVKKNVSKSYMYFKDNYERFHDYRKYVFKETINQQQRAMLQRLHRPIIEFNILDAYISRLLGEFSKHEPSIEVTPAEGVPVEASVLDIVEGYLRHILHTANKDNFSYNIYQDILSGGFSVAKVWTDYSSPMSFEQQIYLSRVFDPTLCGFDPMARARHKGDGQYSFEIHPMAEEDFLREFPQIDLASLSFTRSLNDSGYLDSFNWSYKDNQNNKIVLVADYYEKKKKRTKIVKLADGRVMTMKNYEKMQAYWEEQQFIEQLPIIVGDPRWTDLETICCYKLIENQVLEYTETDYTYLPHIFVDGNSIDLTIGNTNTTYQMTKPYVYHAKGVQDLKNFAGIALANYLENMIQHKFIVKKEAIPQEQDYVEALNDIQQANTVVVNAFCENNPELPIPDPIREVQNLPAPPEVMGAFQITDPTTQTILGSFASNLGKNDNDLSGKAVIESATVGNAASMPYIVGYLSALTQIGNIVVDLIPKYVIGKRTIPVVAKDGKKSYRDVNTAGNPKLDYQERAIKVNIDAGVNFQVQKNQAMDQIVALMGASQEFSQFMNSPQGLEILVDNLTVYGSDRLKEAVPQWIASQQQQQQQASQLQQQAQQNDPRMLKAQADLQKVQLEAQQQQLNQQQIQIENQFEIAKLATDKILADAKLLESQAKISQSEIDSAVRLEESQTSLERHALDAAAKMAEVKGREHEMHIKTHTAMLHEKKLEHEIRSSENAKTEIPDNV